MAVLAVHLGVRLPVVLGLRLDIQRRGVSSYAETERVGFSTGCTGQLLLEGQEIMGFCSVPPGEHIPSDALPPLGVEV